MMELVFEGKTFTNWIDYSVDVDIRRPASSFRFSVRKPSSQSGPVTPGGVAEIKVDGNTILWGRIDKTSSRRAPGQVGLTLHGRSAGGLLVDAAAKPTWRWKNATLETVAKTIANYVGMLRSPNVEYSPTLKAVKVEPGERCWALVDRLARSEGMRIWVDAGGTLQLSQYISAGPSKGRLVSRPDGKGVNVIDSTVSRSCLESFSQYEVFGHWDDGTRTARPKAWHVDLSAPYFKPEVLVEEVRGETEALHVVRDVSSRNQAKRLELEYVVKGHTTDAGVPWQVNTLVDVEDLEEEIAGQFIVLATRFTRSKSEGTRTALTLADPSVFLG